MSPRIRLHLHAIFVPGALHIFVRDLALEHGLLFGLHRQVGDALIHLQLLLYKMVDKVAIISHLIRDAVKVAWSDNPCQRRRYEPGQGLGTTISMEKISL